MTPNPGTLARILLLSALTLPAQAQTRGKIVDCRIVSESRTVFAGKCRFVPDGPNGTFTLQTQNGDAPLYAGVSSVTVAVEAPGEAQVAGLTTEGVNSRWGAAKRSREDPACWTGDDFAVCAH